MNLSHIVNTLPPPPPVIYSCDGWRVLGWLSFVSPSDADFETEMDYIHAKVGAGADFIITQTLFRYHRYPSLWKEWRQGRRMTSEIHNNPHLTADRAQWISSLVMLTEQGELSLPRAKASNRALQRRFQSPTAASRVLLDLLLVKNKKNPTICAHVFSAQPVRCICESIPQNDSDTRTAAMSTDICAGKVWTSPHRRLPLSPLVGCCASLAKNQPTCAQLRPTCSSIESST